MLSVLVVFFEDLTHFDGGDAAVFDDDVAVQEHVLDADRFAADPTLPARAYEAIRDNGLISRVIAGDSLQISPPLVITESELDELASLMRAGLDEVA